MSFSDKDIIEEPETLIALNMEETGEAIPLSQADLQRFAELSQEFQLTDSMESEESLENDEIIIEQSGNMDIEEEIVETDIGAEEIEVETERGASPDEILPDLKTKNTLPPLRPLTIAPKPTKVPIIFKPVTGGQQILIGYNNSTPAAGQTIKLLSPQGQELSIANLQLARPIKTGGGTLVKNVLPVVSQAPSGQVSVLQQKAVLVKKVTPVTSVSSPPTSPLIPKHKFSTKTVTGKFPQHFLELNKHFIVPKKTTPPPAPKAIPIATQIGATRTITLQQAQEMGILPQTRYIQTSTAQVKPATTTLLLNKDVTTSVAGTKMIKLVPQQINAQQIGGLKVLNQIKTPTKILPAGKQLIIKDGSTAQTATILPQQIIQVAGSPQVAGQLHQINIPGKGMQFIKFVPTTSTVSTTTPVKTTQTHPRPPMTLQTTPGGSLILSEFQPLPVPRKRLLIPQQKTNTQVMVVPSSVASSSSTNLKVAIPKQNSTIRSSTSTTSPTVTTTSSLTVAASPEIKMEPKVLVPNESPTSASANNGIRPRKPCNCTKSQCLKLYCDCFANGEFCYMCNCVLCYNNLENEEYRQRAIRTCLERNPSAFRPKIGKAKDEEEGAVIRKHTKGCNCKRSGCLKNYCECYEAKIACSSNCKCVGCRNIEDTMDKKNSRNISNNGFSMVPIERIVPKLALPLRDKKAINSGRQAVNFITDEVIEATCQCLMSISDKAEDNMELDEVAKKEILVEYGRCLNEIISSANSKN